MKQLIVLLCLMMATSSVYANSVSNKYNNEMIKECLDLYGYDRNEPDVQKRLDSFDFTQASSCVGDFRYDEWKKRIDADRQFIAEHPWFRGKNWKWEERAEYTCRRVTTLKGTFEVCSKPIYLN